LLLFLLESGILGLVGGVLGVLFGIGLAKIVGVAAAQAGFSLLKIQVSYGVVLLGLAFAFFVGMLSGVLPARQAAKMQPVEALSYAK